MVNLELIFLRTTFGLVVVGLYSLFLTEQMSPILSLLALVVLAFSYFNEQSKRPIRPPIFLLNFLAVGTLFFQAYLHVYGGKLLIWSAIDFLIVLQTIRLLAEKQDRDYLQIFGLSLLHLIGACVLTASLQFALVFFIYIIVGTWALSLYNLRRELRLANRMDAIDSIVTRRFFLSLSVLAVFVFICSIVLFAFFPRLNYSYFAGALQKESPTSGFNNEVKLGQTGKIKLNQRPIMRVSLSGKAASEIKPFNFYVRGATLTFYDGQGWRNTEVLNQQMLSNQFNRTHFLRGFSQADVNLTQEIVLEPNGIDSIFGVDRMIGLEVPMGVISHRDGQNFVGSFVGSQRIKYTVYSQFDRPSLSRARRRDFDIGDIAKSKMTLSLQVPHDLDPAIVLLARQITAQAKNDFDRVIALENYLKNKLVYSLEMTDPQGEDPIRFFLLTSKKGHCEYFASSLALMGRSLGIPMRIVSGYFHGEYNPVGGFFLFRESHAHTWVEAFFPDAGWMTFDPTPPDPALNNPVSFRERFNHLYDSMELMWVNWVVDYNFDQQRSAFFSLTPKHQSFKNESEKATADIKEDLKRGVFDAKEYFVYVLPLLLTLGVIYLLRQWRRQKENASGTKTFRFYRDMEIVLAKKGLHRKENMTPLEFEKFLDGKLPHASGQIVHDLTQAFCQARYSQQNVRMDLEQWAAKGVVRLKQDLSKSEIPAQNS